MHKMSDKELQLYIRGVILLILSMLAVAMVGEVAKQNWNSKVTAYPTKTEEAINNYAAKLLGEMTLEEKVAQMFFATETSDSELVSDLGLGGLLLSDCNLENLQKTEVQAVVGSFQSGSDIPMFIGVEEEGGDVNTVSKYELLRSVPYLSAAELMMTGGSKLVATDTEDKCEFLRGLGVNVNFAPVCDVVTEESAFLYGRALGRDADATARYVQTVVETMSDEGMIAVLKHFPGYGNAASAVGMDSRSMEIFETEDFLPFRQGIKAGADLVMMSHTVVTALDEELPASLSRKVHTTLRRSFGFDGVVITSDLGAEGLAQYGDSVALAVAAVQAGSDMVLTSDFESQIPAVVRAVMNGDISRERIDESVLRILKLKIQMGILV